jgi:osmotically-inducible protein OsmY
MFGSQSLGSPSGASPSGMGSGMTQGMGSNNSSGPLSGGGATTGTQMGSGLVGGMQQLQAGGQQGFVGQTAATSQNFFSRQGTPGAPQARQQSFGSLTGLMNASRQNQFNQQQAQKASRGTTAQGQAPFRVPLRVGFQPQAVQGSRVEAPLTARLMKMQSLTRLGPIEARMVTGRTVVLRGTVASEADRHLAESLARLEPEVAAVDNQLVVGRTETLPPAAGTTSP